MTLEIINTLEGLESLEAEWETLWRNTDDTTPFQSPDWLLPWWSSFGSGELHVIAGRNDHGLYALAPLYILRDEDSGDSLGLLLGTGVSDYGDAIAKKEHGEALIDQLAAAECDSWDLHQLPTASALLTPTTLDRWQDETVDHDSCPRLDIRAAGEDLQKMLSTHSRKKLRYARRALERLGGVSLEIASANTLDEMMTSLFQLHSARWLRRDLPGVLSDDVIQRFHREVARRMLVSGLLRLFVLRVQEKVAGVLYGFADRTTFYYYLSGYDPEMEHYSIGNILVAHAIEAAARSGATTFDFLRGAEKYKYAWGAQDRMNRRRLLTRDG